MTAVFAFATLAPVFGAANEAKDSLEEALKADVKLSKLSLHGTPSVIGSKFILKVENIQAMPTDGFLPNSNVIENGARHEANKGQRLATGLLNMSTRKTQGMQIEPESKVGILKINVGKGSVNVQVVTLKQEKITLHGDQQSEYLWTWLQFPFKELGSIDANAVKQTIYAALMPENGISAAPAAPEAPAKAEIKQVSSPVPAPGNNELIGREVVDLIALLGQPTNKLDVGAQTIYVYKGLDLRVAVKDGKVVSAQ